MASPLVVSWLTAAAVWCLLVGLDLRREAARSRIRRFLWGVENVDLQDAGRTLLERAGPKIAPLFPAGEMENLARRLVWAGSPHSLTPEGFVALRVLLAAGLPTAAFLGSLGRVPAPLLVASGFLGYMGPSLWLDRRVRSRQDEIRRRLPAFIDLLSVMLSAGKDLDAALAETASCQGGALAEEVLRACQRAATGTPRAAALREMAARTGVPEVSQFAQTVVTGEQSGQGVARTLVQFADQMRYGRQMQAEKAANQAAVKMLFPIVVFIFVPFLLLIGFAACQPILQLGRF